MRRWLARVLLLATSTALALGGAEWAARAGLLEGRLTEGGAVPTGTVRAECVVPSATRGWTAAANVCDRGPLGMFQGGHVLERAPEVPRVLWLGDSVSAADRWVRKAEAKLRASVHPQLEIWNAGIAGYSTCQEADLLRELIGAVDPDVVLVQTCVNDLSDSMFMIPDGQGRTRIRRGTREVSVPTWALSSRLLTLLAVHRASTAGTNAPIARGDAVRSCLLKMQQLSTAAGASFGVIHVPYLVDPDHPGATSFLADERALVALTAELGLPAMDLRPVLTTLGPLSQLAAHNDPIHFGRGATLQLVGDTVGEALAGTPFFHELKP